MVAVDRRIFAEQALFLATVDLTIGAQWRELPGTLVGNLHEVVQSRDLLHEAGFQCAFCAPGFIMAMTGFLATNDSPTRREAAEGISGNLCRCCDYNKILDSCMRAADYVREGIPTEVNSNG